MNRKFLPALAAVLWIAGLILFIVGLNIRSDTGTWLTTIGSISFLVGLGLEGFWYLRKRKQDAIEADEQ